MSNFTRVYEKDKNVFQAAEERIVYIFDNYDYVVISFSGGKDSSILMNLSRREALRRGKVIDVLFFDDELIDPDTIAYVERCRNLPGINLRWLCVPVMHSFRSDIRSYWWTWDPDEKDKWVRPIPPYAITSIPGFEKSIEKSHFDDATGLLYPKEQYGNRVIHLSGVRTQEGLNRHRGIMNAGDYISPRGHSWYGKPIYDWLTTDVWKAIYLNKWDYSRAYDKMARLGRGLHNQRVGPWGNVSASRETSYLSELYPEAWEKAIVRLPELIPQARYGNTKLYRRRTGKPAGLTWQEWALELIQSLDDAERKAYWTKEVRDVLRRWGRKNSIPFPEEPIKTDGKIGKSSWMHLAARIDKNDMMPRDRFF